MSGTFVTLQQTFEANMASSTVTASDIPFDDVRDFVCEQLWMSLKVLESTGHFIVGW